MPRKKSIKPSQSTTKSSTRSLTRSTTMSDDTDSSDVQYNHQQEQLPPFVSQLFTACMNNDIATMKQLINNNNNNNTKGKKTNTVKNFHLQFPFDLKQQYKIPKTSYLYKTYQISLLDAAILSNSPTMIDYVIGLLYDIDEDLMPSNPRSMKNINASMVINQNNTMNDNDDDISNGISQFNFPQYLQFQQYDEDDSDDDEDYDYDEEEAEDDDDDEEDYDEEDYDVEEEDGKYNLKTTFELLSLLGHKIGFRPFALGLLTNKLRSVQHLHQHYQIKPADYSRQFQNCCKAIMIQKNFNVILYLIKYCNAEQYIPHEQLYQPLQSSIQNNDIEQAKVLLQIGIDVNEIIDSNPNPLLYNVIQNKQWKMAQLLLQHNAQLYMSQDFEVYDVLSHILHYAIHDHNVEESFIDYLLSRPDINIEDEDNGGRTPILTAALYGNLRILKHLVGNYNPNVHYKSKLNRNLYHYALLSSSPNQQSTLQLLQLLDTIKLLGVNINVIDRGFNDFDRYATPLTYAIYCKMDFEIIKKLVELGADVITENDKRYRIPSHDADSEDDDNDNDSEDYDDDSAEDDDDDDDNESHDYTNYIDCIDEEDGFPHHADNDVYDYYDIHYRAHKRFQSHLQQSLTFNDNFRTFDFLLQSCPIATSTNIKSILFNAFKQDKFDTIKHIIENHRERFDSDTTPINIFDYMFDECQYYFNTSAFEIVEYLLQQNVQGCFEFNCTYTSFHDRTPLLIFADYPESTLNLLQLMVQNGSNIHAVVKNGTNIIHILCNQMESDTDDEQEQQIDDIHLQNIIEKIDYFVSLGVNVNLNINVRGNKIKTPLHCAVQNSSYATTLVPHLIQQHNANIQLRDVKNRVPLHYVQHPQLVPLLSSNSTINVRDSNGQTPISHILRDLFDPIDLLSQIILALLAHGADVNIPNIKYETPIHIMLKQQFFRNQPLPIITAIIQHSNINTLNLPHKEWKTPLELAVDDVFYFQRLDDAAVSPKAIESIKLLLQHNANPILHHHWGHSIFHYILKKASKSENINTPTDALIQTCIDAIIDSELLNN